MTTVIIVSESQALSARLPEVLAGHGLIIQVIGGRNGQLLASPFVDAYEVIAAGSRAFTNALLADPGLLDRGADWILFDSDQLIHDLARSGFPHDLLIRILPASTDLGIASLGSKAGQQVLVEAAGVPTPLTRIARTRAEIGDAIRELGTDIVIKGNLGGGGAAVRILRESPDWQSSFDGDVWLPALVQERVQGPLISVEPLYQHGRLLGFVYSEMLATMGHHTGPSTVRRYREPLSPDIRDSLEHLGEAAGFHGFGNLTFLWCPRRRMHLLIECDMHVNTWVQFGPRLGVDWGALMTIPDTYATPRCVSNKGARVIHLFPRELEAGLADRRWSHVRPWMLREPGTWDARNALDPVVNAVEGSAIAHPRSILRNLVFSPLQRTWNRLPSSVRTAMEDRGWKARALRGFGYHP